MSQPHASHRLEGAESGESGESSEQSTDGPADEPAYAGLVPDLRDLPRWIVYTPDKTPLSPETGKGVDPTDPSNGVEFDRAWSFAESQPHVAGVGYLMSDQDLYCGVDLDCCITDDGDMEPWAEDILSRLDTYAEVSSGGNGIHVLLEGSVVDEKEDAEIQNTIEELAELDHRTEVAVFESGYYFAFTFEHISETPATVEMRNKELQSVYEAYVYEESDDELEKTTDPDEPVTDDDKELLELIRESDQGEKFESLWSGELSEYNGDHSRADMALMDILAFWTQKDESRMKKLFKQSGLWSDARKKEKSPSYVGTTVSKACTHADDVYDPDYGSEIDEDDSETSTIPEPMKTKFEQRNCGYGYWVSSSDEDDRKWNEVTNFLIDVESYLVDDQGQRQVQARVIPRDGDEFEVMFRPKVFNEVRNFKNSVCVGFTTTFSGDMSDLDELRQIVGKQDAPVRTPTRALGIHDDVFVAPDGVYDASGEVDDPSYAYRQTGSAFEDGWESDSLHREYDDDTVSEILRLLPKCRQMDRGLTVLGWWFGSLFAPLIREWERELPSLNISGESGSGKSNFIRVLYELTGMDNKSYSPKSSAFTLTKQMSASTSIPVWYDEYKPSDMTERDINVFHDKFRKATNAGIETRGRPDQTEERYVLQAPIITTGEEAIRGSASERRSILVTFSPEATKQDTPTSDAFHSLKKLDYSEFPPALWQSVLTSLDDREDLEMAWEKGRENVEDIIEAYGIEGLGDLERTGLTMVRFGLSMYKVLCDKYLSTQVIDDGDIRDAILYAARQKGDGARQTHLEQFLELMSQAASERYLTEGNHYKIVEPRHGEYKCEFRFKLSKTHAAVSKYASDYNLNGYELFDTPGAYRSRLEEQVADDESYVIDTGTQTKGLNRSISLSPEVADRVDGFEFVDFNRV